VKYHRERTTERARGSAARPKSSHFPNSLNTVMTHVPSARPRACRDRLSYDPVTMRVPSADIVTNDTMSV